VSNWVTVTVLPEDDTEDKSNKSFLQTHSQNQNFKNLTIFTFLRLPS